MENEGVQADHETTALPRHERQAGGSDEAQDNTGWKEGRKVERRECWLSRQG